MSGKALFGWFLIITAAWFLLSGLIGGDMGGIVALGYNPDMPLSYSLAPGRFVLGILIHGAMLIYGIRTLVQAGQEGWQQDELR